MEERGGSGGGGRERGGASGEVRTPKKDGS